MEVYTRHFYSFLSLHWYFELVPGQDHISDVSPTPLCIICSLEGYPHSTHLFHMYPKTFPVAVHKVCFYLVNAYGKVVFGFWEMFSWKHGVFKQLLWEQVSHTDPRSSFEIQRAELLTFSDHNASENGAFGTTSCLQDWPVQSDGILDLHTWLVSKPLQTEIEDGFH